MTIEMAWTLLARSSGPLGSGPAWARRRADASTRSLTSGGTSSGRLKTFEAVPCDTLAAFATSASLTIRFFITPMILTILKRFNDGLDSGKEPTQTPLESIHMNRFNREERQSCTRSFLQAP